MGRHVDCSQEYLLTVILSSLTCDTCDIELQASSSEIKPASSGLEAVHATNRATGADLRLINTNDQYTRRKEILAQGPRYGTPFVLPERVL